MDARDLKYKCLECIQKIENIGGNKYTNWFIWGIYTIFIVFVAYHHEPWYDEYHSWSLVYRLNFVHLWQILRVEGHFGLWYWLLWPWVKWLGMDWHALYYVSVPLMSLAVWLVLHKLQFSFVGKLLIISSSLFLYLFPIIARCYALIPPILVGIAILYQKKKYPVLYCVLLGILANTHAYMEGLVFVLWLIFVYRYVWKIDKAEVARRNRNVLASFSTVFLTLFALIQVIGGLFDVMHGVHPAGEGLDTLEEWCREFIYGHRIMCFDILHQKYEFIPKLDTLLTLCAYIGIIVSVWLLYTRCKNQKWEVFGILFGGIAWQILFATNIYGMHNHRIWLLYFVVVLVIWMYFYQQEYWKYICVFLSCCWLLFAPFYYKIWKDIRGAYAEEIVFANKIQEIMPSDAILYSDDEDETECLLIDALPLDTAEISQLQHKDCWIFTRNDSLTISNHLLILEYSDSERYLYHVYSVPSTD